MESNQLTKEQFMIQKAIARDAMALDHNKHDLVTFMNAAACLVNRLESEVAFKIFDKDRELMKARKWMNQHPIVKLLAFRIKFEVLVDPDCSYQKTKAQLERMVSVDF